MGASGWLGRALSETLKKKGAEVIPFSRSRREGWRQWDGCSVPDLSGLDAIVNLAGEPVDQRWTSKSKKKFHTSRVDLTQFLVEGIADSEVHTLLNSSGVGFYGTCQDRELTEKDAVGSNFLAKLCLDWEKAASEAKIRSVFLRTGVVLGKDGRAWKKMEPLFRLGLGGRLGHGQQWMPWIHLHDEVAAMIHCLESDLAGPVNLVAPESVRNVDFTREFASVLKRPAFIPAPEFMLNLLLGDFAQEGLMASLRVVPQVLLDSGFEFQYPDLRSALEDLTS